MIGGAALGEVDVYELLLGVVGREVGRAICKGLVVDAPGAENDDAVPLERDGDRARRVGKGGARDIK